MVTRDKAARWLCNWALKHIATPEYREKIDLLIKQGMFHTQYGGPFLIARDDKDDAA